MSSYMDTREGQFLKHIVPEHHMEVYLRVQKNVQEKYEKMITNVKKQRKRNIDYLRRVDDGTVMYDWEDNTDELERAEEHLDRFIKANADYLI